jgi:hypothetical protein
MVSIVLFAADGLLGDPALQSKPGDGSLAGKANVTSTPKQLASIPTVRPGRLEEKSEDLLDTSLLGKTGDSGMTEPQSAYLQPGRQSQVFEAANPPLNGNIVTMLDALGYESFGAWAGQPTDRVVTADMPISTNMETMLTALRSDGFGMPSIESRREYTASIPINGNVATMLAALGYGEGRGYASQGHTVAGADLPITRNVATMMAASGYDTVGASPADGSHTFARPNLPITGNMAGMLASLGYRGKTVRVVETRRMTAAAQLNSVIAADSRPARW